MLLIDWSCFYFGAVDLITGLMISLAINNAVSIVLKIAFNLLK